MDHVMRKSGIVVTVLLLIAVLALMVASTGLLPIPPFDSKETGTPPSITMPFSNSQEKETEHIVELRPKLAVETPHGQIILQGGDVEQIQVHMHVQTRAASPVRAQELLGGVSLEITNTAEENKLQVLAPRIRNNEMARADLIITVPIQTNLDLKTSLGEVEITNIQGSARVLDHLGTIKLRDFQGDAYLETSLGNIEIANSQFDKELVALSHLGDLTIEGSLANRNVLESSLGDLTLLLSPDESYVLEGSLSLGSFNVMVPFKGQQNKERIKGVLGEGEQRGSIFVDLSLGSLELKNQTNGRDEHE